MCGGKSIDSVLLAFKSLCLLLDIFNASGTLSSLLRVFAIAASCFLVFTLVCAG